MGYLIPLVLALLVVGVAEEGLGPLTDAPALAALGLPVPWLLAWAAQRLGVRGRFRLAACARVLLATCGLWLHAAALLGLGWQAAVAARFGTEAGLAGWPEPAQLLSLTPFLVFEVLAIDARARADDPRPEGARSVRSFQLRLLVASLALPVFFGALAWLVSLNERWRIGLEELGLANAAFSAGLIAALFFLMPFFMRLAWSTQTLPAGVSRQVLEAVAERAGFRFRELLLWQTGGMVANAAIVGMHRSHRFVLFSDALLARLPPRELAAVFGHEIGHARRGHVALFVTWVLGFIVGTQLLLERFEAWDETAALGLLALLLVGGFFGFGFLSRRCELEADLESLALVGDPEALTNALWLVTSRGAAQKDGWRHFSTARRSAFLGAAARDPGVGRRLRRQLRACAWAGALLAVVSIGFATHALWQGHDEDRVVLSLRLGDYAAAVERSRDVELGDGLGKLVERARHWGTDPGAEALEESARAALAEGRGEAALRDLELAVLAGERRLEPVALALRDVLSGEVRAGLDRLGDRPVWRGLIARQRPLEPAS